MDIILNILHSWLGKKIPFTQIVAQRILFQVALHARDKNLLGLKGNTLQK